MTSPRPLGVRVVTALTILAVVAAPLAAAAGPRAGGSTCAVPGQIDVSDSWRVAKGPSWRAGGRAIAAYAWDAYDSDNLYVTNGAEVQASHDGGCHWSLSYSLPSSVTGGFSSSDSTITDVEVPESASAGDTILATVSQRVQGVDRTHVVRSTDAGRSWDVVDDGLPPTGRPVSLRVAPNHPDVVYLALDVNGGTIDLVYASTDGGETWTLRSDLSKITDPSKNKNPAVIKDLQVDPGRPDELWAPGPSKLYHSIDGGRSFEEVSYFQLETGPVDVFRAPGSPSRIGVFMPAARSWARSQTGGVGWSQMSLRGIKGVVDSVAHGPRSDIMFVTAGGEVYAWNEPTLSWVDVKSPVPGLTGMSATRGNSILFSGHNSSSIATYFGPVSDFFTTLPGDLFNVSQIADADVPVKRPPRLTPATRKVVLAPGKSKLVDYQLRLPARPVPLDVYFLLDSSSSTTNFLSNVAKSVARIAAALRESGIDVHMGLADYRAYPNRFPALPDCGPGERPSEDHCEDNYVYKQDLDITGDGDALQNALESLRAGGGGAFRSMYSALFHSVDGAGEDLGAPGNNPTDHDVPPGQQAHFRQKAVKVIVHATDESFADEHSVPPPNPTDPASLNRPNMKDKGDALTALRTAADTPVYQVGISTGSESLHDLRDVAGATGAVAPASGIDCNGDGRIDVPAGEPLVCSVNPNQSAETAGLVPGIEDLLAGAIGFRTNVTLETHGGDAVIDDVAPNAYSDVILQTAKSLAFQVKVSCPLTAAGKTFEVGLKVDADNLKDVSSRVTVVCRPLPKNAPPALPAPPLAPPAAAALVALAAPPPPPPPPPVIELSSASQSQAQSQAQAQAGMAYQEEQQPQTAFVTAFHEEDEPDLAFTAYRDRSDPLVTPVTLLGAGVVLLSFAFGFVTLSREVAREKVLARGHRR